MSNLEKPKLNYETWSAYVVLSGIGAFIAFMLGVPFSVVYFFDGEYLKSSSLMLIFIAMTFLTVYTVRNANRVEKIEYLIENPPFVEWVDSLQISDFYMTHSICEDGRLAVYGHTSRDFNLGHFIEDKLLYARFFPTVEFNDEYEDNGLLSGNDISRVQEITKIVKAVKFLVTIRKRYQEVTDIYLARYAETFILLNSTEKHLIEMSLDNLVKVRELLEIIKDDVEQAIKPIENKLYMLNSDEAKLIDLRLANELAIVKEIREKHKSLMEVR